MQIHATLTLAATLLAAPIASAQAPSLSAQQRNHFGGVYPFGSSHRFGQAIYLDGDSVMVMHDGASLQEFAYHVNGWSYRASLTGGMPRRISYEGALLLASANGGPTGNGRLKVQRPVSLGNWSLAWHDSPEPGGFFAYAHDIEGSTVVISNSEYSGAFANEGTLYVYEDTGSSLVLRQTIRGGASDVHLGRGVRIDGDQMLATTGGNPHGLRAFERSGGVWNETQSAVPVPPLSIYTIRLDRGNAVVQETTTRLLVLANGGAGWFVEGALPLATTPNYFDFALSDGVIALGVASDDTLADDAGAVWLFARNGGWKLQQVVTANDGAVDDYLGVGVGLEGARLLAGASGHDHYGSDNGGVYGFELTHAPAQVYCVPELTSAGCVAQIGFQGTPSVSNPAPFLITASSVLSDRVGVLVYGTSGRIFQPYAGGVRCLAPPRRTTARQASGNNGSGNCGGAFSVDFNAFLQSGVDPQLVAGAQVNAQWIFRDPAGPSALASSAAIEFNVRP